MHRWESNGRFCVAAKLRLNKYNRLLVIDKYDNIIPPKFTNWLLRSCLNPDIELQESIEISIDFISAGCYRRATYEAESEFDEERILDVAVVSLGETELEAPRDIGQWLFMFYETWIMEVEIDTY